MGLRFGLVCLVVVLLFGEAWTGPVVGIDFGTSWYKVAMIQGHNLDLVLDGAGDRRRNTLLGMHGEERVFGRDAEAMLKRYPTEVFKNILDILGKPYDEVKHLDLIHFPFFEKIQSINGRNSTQISLNPSNENGRAYILPEEIMAMFFKEAMAMASTKAGSKVVDCVVVVPNFYTHHQRQALIDAAKIAEVDILGFLNGNTAAALTYGLNRDKEELEVHRRVVIYDMGYGSTKVSVIEMKQGEDQKKNKTVPVIQVIGHGWDVSLGGRDFDLRIAQFFAKQAEKKVGEGKILGNKRTLERLVKESQRVKEVLSANLDTQIAIPDLVPDYDFFGTITREQFEEASKDLISRSLEPVKKALESAQVTVGDIDYIEVIGGGSRVPAIQRALAEYFGKAAEHHLNGDEAAVFGAAFFAATQSTSFRVKNDILLKDATGFGIDVEVVEGVNLEKSLSKAHLIKPLNRHGSLKKLSFHVNEGELPSRVVLRLSYDSTLAEGAPTEISELVFTGFPLRSDNILDAPKITLSFRLNNHGLLVVETADLEYTVLTLEKDPSSTTSKKSDKDKEKDSKEGAEKASDSAASGEGEEKEKGENEGAESGAEKETEKLIEVKRTKKVHLTVDVKPLGVLPLVAKDVVDAKKYLKDLDRADKLKRETEEARNSIEALVYNAQEKLNEDEDLQKFTNSEEKEKVIEALQEAGNWLYDEGDGATFEVLKSKLKELQGKVDRILNRRVEYEKRNESVGYYLGAIMYVKNETSNITNSHEVEVDEYERFIEYLTTEQEEILRLYDLQNARELDQDPLFTAAELEKKTKEIQRRVRAFKIRPKRKPKVVVEEKAEEIKEETEKAAENVAENVSEKAEETKEETETRSESGHGHEHEDGAQGPDEL